MPTIFLTGGCGFIGTHTCLALLKASYRVIVLDSNINSNKIALEKVLSINKSSTKEYNTPEPQIMPPIPGTEKFINLIKSNKEDSNQFECGQRFLSIMLIFLTSFLYYYIMKYQIYL